MTEAEAFEVVKGWSVRQPSWDLGAKEGDAFVLTDIGRKVQRKLLAHTALRAEDICSDVVIAATKYKPAVGALVEALGVGATAEVRMPEWTLEMTTGTVVQSVLRPSIFGVVERREEGLGILIWLVSERGEGPFSRRYWGVLPPSQYSEHPFRVSRPDATGPVMDRWNKLTFSPKDGEIPPCVQKAMALWCPKEEPDAGQEDASLPF